MKVHTDIRKELDDILNDAARTGQHLQKVVLTSAEWMDLCDIIDEEASIDSSDRKGNLTVLYYRSVRIEREES